MKPSELKKSFSVESYDEKTAENYRNCYVAKKRIVSKLSKVLILKFDSPNEDLNEDCSNISFTRLPPWFALLAAATLWWLPS